MNKFVSGLFFALIATLFVQIQVYESPSGTNTLNLYHVLIAAAFLATFRLRPSVRLSPDTAFFAVLTVTSILGWTVYGLSMRAALLPIAIAAFAVGNRWYQLTTPEERSKTYQAVFAVVVSTIVLRNLINYDSLGAIYSRAHVETSYFCLSSGGKNLEATQLGILSTLLIGTPVFLPSIIAAAVTSLLVISRSGMIAVLLALFLWMVHGNFGRFKLLGGSLVLATAALACLLTIEGTYKIPIIERFDMTQERSYAADDQGRLAIWAAGGRVISDQPLGHGTGNGFPLLNEEIGGHLRENNAHNIFVEFALDGGLQSSVLFACIMLSILRTPGMIVNPAHRCALAYGILGLVEYTGYDAIGWFFIGVSHAARFSSKQLIQQKP